MDYIREELLRQKRILSVLMGGGRQNEAETYGSNEDENLFAEQTAANLFEQTRIVREREMVRHYPRTRSGSLEIPAAETARTAARGSREINRRERAVSAVEEMSVPVRAARYERTAEEGAVGAREISRSIQRDARRYDGGFSTY